MIRKIKIKKVSLISVLISIFLFLSPIESFLSSQVGTLLKYYQLFCICIFFIFILYKKKKIKLFNVGKYLCIFLVLLCFAFLRTAYIDRGLNTLQSIGLQILFIILAMQFDYSKSDQTAMIVSYIIGCIVLAIIFFQSGQLVGNYDNRYSVAVDSETVLDPNNIAGLLSIANVYLFFIRTNKKYLNILKYILICILTVAVLMTASRGAILALLIALCYGLLIQNDWKKAIFLIITSIFIYISIYFINIYFLDNNFIEVIIERFVNDSGGSNRVEIWNSAFKAVLDSPIFGYGIGSSPYIIYKYYGVLIGSHNTIITILLEGGIILASSLIIIFVSIFKNRKNMLFDICVCGGEVASIVCSCFIDSYNKKIFWLPILICCISLCSKTFKGQPITNTIKDE